MRNLRHIVFFWVGQIIVVPTLLVRSIRSSLGPDIRITQLCDRETPEVPGVSICKRMALSSKLMVARLEAYASLTLNEPTLFLDADMLAIRDFDLPPLSADEVGVTPRYDRTEINWRSPVDFPEFEGKYFIDEMPYLYSFVYASSESLFVRQLSELHTLPERFHQWYGDQITLKRELDSGRYMRRDFSIDTYNRTIKTYPEFEQVLSNHPEVCLIHFKGAEGKDALAEAIRRFGGTE